MVPFNCYTNNLLNIENFVSYISVLEIKYNIIIIIPIHVFKVFELSDLTTTTGRRDSELYTVNVSLNILTYIVSF